MDHFVPGAVRFDLDGGKLPTTGAVGDIVSTLCIHTIYFVIYFVVD